MFECVGFVETRGFTAAIEAADSMVKAANVHIVEFKVVGSGLVSVIIQGDVGAVQSAVLVGAERAQKIGEVISVNVIPRPTQEMAMLLPISDKEG
jgi:microcompartment protein CcmL/EutN